MDQKVEPLASHDIDLVEAQRSWVRNHFDEASRHQYETAEGKLRLLAGILRGNWIARDETYKLQCLGITFGDLLAQHLGLEWVIVNDEYGRDPALRDPQTTNLVFPLTAISKRVERGETVDIAELFVAACDKVTELRQQAPA